MSTAEVEGQRIRLEAYFAERGVPPADAQAEIRRLIAKYGDGNSGGFDKMWRNLARKYDGATGQSTTMGATTMEETGTSSKVPRYSDARIEAERQRLHDFYEAYAPTKTAETNKNIKKYSRIDNGFEDMWAALSRKYKVDPPPPIDDTGRSATGSSKKSKRNKHDHGDTDGVMATDANTTSYAETEDAHRARLHRFYSKYAPAKLGDVSKQIVKYADPNTGGYSRMWQQLVDKYGPEPENEERLLASMLDSGNKPGRKYAPNVRDQWRQRLTKFYRFYAPQKGPEDVEDVLDRYGPPNGYETMWQQMLDKYGAEPVDPPSGFVGRYMAQDEADEVAADADAVAPTALNMSAAETGSPSPQRRRADEDAQSMDSPSERRHRRSEDAPSELSSNANPERYPYSPLGFNAVAVVLHAILRFQGATVMLYDKAVEERQRNFRKAIETEVSLNLGIERRQVSVMGIKAGMTAEIAVELTHEQVKHGVGEALVTKVLMGTFTVKHIREAYRRDLGGNPIQLHTEGAAIYGGTCTPLFYDDAPHKPVDDPSAATRFSTAEVAEKWSREAARSAGESPAMMPTSNYVPPASANYARGSSIQAALSPRTETSASPMLSPVSDRSPAAAAGGAPPHSPMRGWGSMPQHTAGSPPSSGAAQMTKEEALNNQRTLRNPHGLTPKPSSAPGRTDPTSTSSFLQQVWGEQPTTARPLPYAAATSPVYQTIEGPPITPGSMSHLSMKERARREAMKPFVLSHTPSTDDIELPTKTAPPHVTVFRPEAVMETHTPAATRFRDAEMQRTQDRRHADELLRAVASPVEYQMEQRRRAGGNPTGFTPESSSPRRAVQPTMLEPSFDRAPAPAVRGQVPSPGFARDPVMQQMMDDRSPSAVLNPKYAPKAGAPPRAESLPGASVQRAAARSSSAAAPYLLDIVEALEV